MVFPPSFSFLQNVSHILCYFLKLMQRLFFYTLNLPPNVSPEETKKPIKQQVHLYCLSERFLRENRQLLLHPYYYFLFFCILEIFQKD